MKVVEDIVAREILKDLDSYMTNLKIPHEIFYENRNATLKIFKKKSQNELSFIRIFNSIKGMIESKDLTKATILLEDIKLPIEEIAKSYIMWYKSNPFDIGNTCRTAFSSSLDEMVENAKKYSKSSESNGSMMRITPIPVLYHMFPYEKIYKYAIQDCKLSHPSEICQEIAGLYTITIAYLINNPGDFHGAIKFVSKWIKDKTVKEWFEDSKSSLSTIKCDKHIGHIKHAFTLAFHFLRKGEKYETAIQETLCKEGDTDTNACIVGGIIGALHGFDNIPEYMKKPVLNFDPTKHGRRRPIRFKSGNIQDDIKNNYAKGSLFGALIGDASGVTLEFASFKVTQEIADKAMHMPGGGVFTVGKGQISDDGELTLSLYHALKEKKITNFTYKS
jgi:ADP-ribosylglycohydrolase